MASGAGRRIFTLLVAALVAFAALLIFMIQSQTDLLFPVHAVPRAGPLPAGAEQLVVATPDGNQLHGVHFRPTDAAQGRSTLILGFGGNAWNGQDVAEYLHDIFPEADVVAFHYRGYRPSTGKPSAKALMADAPLLLDEAVRRIQPERTFAAGFSIGSGVAASLASQRKVDGLILVTPFDSLKAVAREIYPWLPVDLFFQHEFPAAAELSRNTTPVAIIAAEHDEIIPAATTAALRQQVPTLVFDRTIASAGHNDIYQRAEFPSAMREAMTAIAAK